MALNSSVRDIVAFLSNFSLSKSKSFKNFGIGGHVNYNLQIGDVNVELFQHLQKFTILMLIYSLY